MYGGVKTRLARRNVELKATDPDPRRSLRTCRSLGARDCGVIVQRDTYFEVRIGGLKLREETPGKPHLIQFIRASQPDQRESRYRIVEVDDADVLSAALAESLGTSGIVVKRRRLLLWNDVRIHLDEVEGLGSFIELEAVAPPESDLTREHDLVVQLRKALLITDDRLSAEGYAEQLLRGGGRGAAGVLADD
jgi:predicted adenylyl cyclase CyaB